MKSMGIVRKFDNLGRVVIPKEIRKTHGWSEQTPIEIFATEDGVFIKAYQNNVDKENTLAYLRSQLLDATNEDDIQSIKAAISYVSKG